MVNVQVPGVAGVPPNVAVLLPLSVKVTPAGSGHDVPGQPITDSEITS